jgi:hypothetical protein
MDVSPRPISVEFDPQETSRELLLDHLVGQREQFRRDVESDRLGGLGIDHQLIFRRLYDRKVGRCGSQKNLPDIHADLAKCVGEVRP